MAAVDTTDIGLWGEYYYSWFFGQGVYIPEDYDLENLKPGQNAIVPHWNTQHGFMRWNKYGSPEERNEGLLQIAQPRLTMEKDTKPAYWEVENTERATVPTTRNARECIPGADHSETCFINWLRGNPKGIVEIFTNFSPCCKINNSKGSGCTERLIEYCNENPTKKVRVFFYRWYLPQNQSQARRTVADAEKAYKEFLTTQTIPPNLELYKIKRDPAKKELVVNKWSKWSTARGFVIEKEECEKITNTI